MNINLIAPICSTGYGVAGTNFTKALTKAGHKLTLYPIGQADCLPDDIPIFQQAVNNAGGYDPEAPCVRIWHQFQLDQFVGRGHHIGFPIFELDKFNEVETHHLKSVDRLFVCSNWAKKVIENNNISVHTDVVPLGVDPTIFYPSQVERPANQPYTFMNAGKWEVRKGHDVLVDIFNKAFELEDDVRLWLLPHNPFLNEQETNEWARKYKESKLGSKIMIISPCKTSYDVASLMRQADCGIFPSRAEGWNLELLELMACGKPCIATNYSAHTEFCTNEDTWFIDIDETEPAEDGKWFFKQGNWAKIGEKQIDQAVRYMRLAYKNRNGAWPEPTERKCYKQAIKFTWKKSSEIFINCLSS